MSYTSSSPSPFYTSDIALCLVHIHTMMQKLFRINITVKPELFILHFMDVELEKKKGKLLHMETVGSFLFTQRWKNNEICTVKGWIIKFMELAKMVKLTSFSRGKKIKMETLFISCLSSSFFYK